MSAAWKYRAAAAGGQVVEGVVQAANERAARDELRRQTLVPIEVQSSAPVTARRNLLTLNRKLEAAAVAMRALATLVSAGTTLDVALDFAARESDDPLVAGALAQARRDVHGGSSLANAFAQHTEIFGKLAPAMVRAGEESGSLGASLDRLAQHMERVRDLRAQLQSSLIYPALLGAMASLGIVVMLMFVVPRFVGMLSNSGVALPLSTRILVGVSNGFTSLWWLWVGIVAVGALLGTRLKSSPQFVSRWHRIRLGWPLVGDLERRLWTARFSRSLSIMLGSGGRLMASLRVARESVGNVAMASLLDSSIAMIERGEGIARSLHGVLPPLAVHLLGVGEQSGALDEMAGRIADTFDGEVQRSLRTVAGLVEPALILVFGGIVGFVALAMLQAIYAINAGVL